MDLGANLEPHLKLCSFVSVGYTNYPNTNWCRDEFGYTLFFLFVFRAKDESRGFEDSIRSSFSEQSTGLSDCPDWLFPTFPVHGKQTKHHQLIQTNTTPYSGTETSLCWLLFCCVSCRSESRCVEAVEQHSDIPNPPRDRLHAVRALTRH